MKTIDINGKDKTTVQGQKLTLPQSHDRNASFGAIQERKDIFENFYGKAVNNAKVKNKSRVFDHYSNKLNEAYDRHKKNYVKIDGNYSPVVIAAERVISNS